MQVYLIEEYDYDEGEHGRYAGWKTPDPDDGIWLDQAVAQAHVDQINAERLECWLVGNNGYVDDHWRFQEAMDRWKTANFDRPEVMRTPKPKRVKRTKDNYPTTNNARVIAYPVKEA